MVTMGVLVGCENSLLYLRRLCDICHHGIYIVAFNSYEILQHGVNKMV
jgi:hypothetical protein